MNPKLDCPRCKKKQNTILKMGGLICEVCRIIIADRGSDEHSKAIKDARKRDSK